MNLLEEGLEGLEGSVPGKGRKVGIASLGAAEARSLRSSYVRKKCLKRILNFFNTFRNQVGGGDGTKKSAPSLLTTPPPPVKISHFGKISHF